MQNQIKKLIGNYLSFVKNHTFLQTWNTVKYKINEKLPFHPTHLMYGPLKLNLRLTSMCNQRCFFCPRKSPITESGYIDFNDMTLENFKSIIDEFKSAISINMTGGEPFLNNEIFEMIEYAGSKKMKVTIVTNGVLMHDKVDQIITSSLSEIFFSIHADNPTDYENMHGVSKKAFYKVTETIEELVKKRENYSRNLNLTINHVCTKRNYKKMPDMIYFAKELGVDRLNFLNLIPFNIPNFSKKQSLYEDDQDVIDLIDNIELKNSKLKVIMPILNKRQIKGRLCEMPFIDLTINGDGYVSFCCELPEEEKYGNVLRKEDVWNNAYFKRTREMLIDNSEPLFDVCKFCPSKGKPYKILN